MNFNKYDTFIFDFDGTLINSEPYHKIAHSKVLSLILNRKVELTDEDFSRYIGKNDNEIFEMYKKDFNITQACRALGIKSNQTFYNALKRLEEHRLIRTTEDVYYLYVVFTHTILIHQVLRLSELCRFHHM